MAVFSTVDEFKALVNEVRSREGGYSLPQAYGIGIARYSLVDPNKVLDVSFLVVSGPGENEGTATLLAEATRNFSGSGVNELPHLVIRDVLDWLNPFKDDGGEHPNIDALELLAEQGIVSPQPVGKSVSIKRKAIVVWIDDLQSPPVSVEDAYLRLHLLSELVVRPNTINVTGIFAALPKVVWTNHGPFDPNGFKKFKTRLQLEGLEIQVNSVDVFPPMLNYVIPDGVRIADGRRVRLGAHLSPGTVVMHEGFCNYNAGTLGKSMVEGRISQGVTIGAGSDLGGGSSTMGTLSGGGNVVITLGESCLIGANGGTGICLGDHCKVEAGLYVTAGAPVHLPNGNIVKARELSGKSGLVFRRGQNGFIEVVPADQNQVALNPILH